VKIAYVQTNPRHGAREENFKRAEALVVDVEADAFVFPELFSTGYLFENREELAKLAEPIDDSPTFLWMRKIAGEKNCVVCGGFPELDKEKNRIYNSAAIASFIGPPVVHYRKLHLFNQEKELFDPGDLPPRAANVGLAIAGIMICFDWIFPETMRLLALNDAQIVFHPANLILPHCQAAMVTRSLENRLFSVTANRIGTEEIAGKKLTFTGCSQIVAPDGKVLAQASADKEEVGVVEIDPNQASDKMITENNHILKDRRVDMYGALIYTDADRQGRL
jgi:predicted amidohydrolase